MYSSITTLLVSLSAGLGHNELCPGQSLRNQFFFEGPPSKTALGQIA